MSGTPSKDEKPQIEIASDEDWKSRVKAEDARLDQEVAHKHEVAESAPEEDDDDEVIDASRLPPPSLMTLFQMLSSQSIVAMGMIPAPNGKSILQLPLAKHFIDMLSVLEEKCKGNLSPDEQKFLDGTLHELRLAYVEVSRRQNKPA